MGAPVRTLTFGIEKGGSCLDVRDRTILLVEDEAIIAMAEKLLLQREGYHVVVAGSGEDAIRIVEENPQIDLALMDIDLGRGMDGTAAAAQILRLRDIPVLFLSSHTDGETVERTERITSYGYVVKSSSPTVLFASIKMAFKLHHADQTILQDRDTLQAMMDASPVGMLVIDPRLEVVRVNAAAERIAGRRLAEMDHPRCGDFLGCVNRWEAPGVCGETLHCSSCTLFQHISLTVNQRTGVHQHIAQFRLASGDDPAQTSPRWLSYNTAPVQIDGQAAALVTMDDITGRRDEEERMRLLGAIADSTTTLVIITDVQRRVTWINPSCLALTGYEQNDLIGRNPGDVLQGDNPDLEMKARMTAAFNRGDPFQGEILNYRRDGTPYWIWMDIQPVRDPDGEVTHFVAVEKDITAQRQFEQQLITRDERVREIVERTSDGIVEMDGSGTVVYANPAYLRMMGAGAGEILGSTPEQYFALIHPEDAAVLQQELYAGIAAGARQMVYRFRMRRGDGTWFWREDHSFSFYDTSGVLERSYVFSREIAGQSPPGVEVFVVR